VRPGTTSSTSAWLRPRERSAPVNRSAYCSCAFRAFRDQIRARISASQESEKGAPAVAVDARVAVSVGDATHADEGQVAEGDAHHRELVDVSLGRKVDDYRSADDPNAPFEP
jgi:hypothetical protein